MDGAAGGARFVVLGGGCYGTFYARQLARAKEAGALDVADVLVVDRDPDPPARRELGESAPLRYRTADWDAFLDDYLAALPTDAGDRLVPSPFTPHLALAWLLRRLRRDRPERRWDLEPFRRFPGTPFQRQDPGGPLLVSHADWVCPVHCIEPETCPATRGPRHWDLARTADHLADALADAGQPVEQVHLFRCRHVAFGVGAYPAADVPRALRRIQDALDAAGTRTRRFLIGTVSHCHGALHLLRARHGTLPVSTGGAVSGATDTVPALPGLP